jgi:spore coat protein CotH
MSDTETVRVARLNDENYLEWLTQMEGVLIKHGLWSVISHSIVWTEKLTAEEFAAEVETWRSK